DDAGVRGTGGLLERESHAAAPFSSAAAASRSSGVLTATVGVPRSPRLARPVRAPAGASSTSPVMPLSANEAMHRSHRTGDETWFTTSSRACAPDATADPSLLVHSESRGSF